VEYGPSTEYGATSTGETSFRWATHSQLIDGLAPGTLYHFRTHSADERGNEAYSADHTFSTLGASPPPAGTCFGSCFAGDSLANTQVGTDAEAVAYSFRARGSQLESIRFYWQGGPGYGAGSGGTIEASIRSTVRGLPGSDVLASASFRGRTAAGQLVVFEDPADLARGDLYWVVFANVDPHPDANYTSANATVEFAYRGGPRQPNRSNDELEVYYLEDSGWVRRSGYTALLDLGYADGTHDGQGYMEFWVHPGQAAGIGGDLQVRETFSNPIERTVSTMAVRVERVSGSSPLTVSLYSGDLLVARGSVPASDIARSSVASDGGQSWAVVDLAAPVVLPRGPSSLVLTASADTRYSTHAIRKGGRYGYTAGATYFAYGSAQYSKDSGSRWTHFNDQRNGSDIQFYLR
jgi:hypothetical protein